VLIIDQPNLDIFPPQDLNTFWKRINGMTHYNRLTEYIITTDNIILYDTSYNHPFWTEQNKKFSFGDNVPLKTPIMSINFDSFLKFGNWYEA
jgi:hypothetical protein